MAIGIVFHVILFSVAIGVHDISDAYSSFVDGIFSFFADILLLEPLSSQGFSYGESLVISAIFIFSVGVFAGWIYGKRKLVSKPYRSVQ